MVERRRSNKVYLGIALALGLLGSGCVVSAPPEGFARVGPDLWVEEDVYGTPVYFADGYFWYRSSDSWYRSRHWRHGRWDPVGVAGLPRALQRGEPRHERERVRGREPEGREHVRGYAPEGREHESRQHEDRIEGEREPHRSPEVREPEGREREEHERRR